MSPDCTEMPIKWYRRAKLRLSGHLDLFFNGFDPVKDHFLSPDSICSLGNKPTLNLPFALPLLVNVITVLQGLFGFTDESEERGLRFSESKRFVTHQIFPRPFWFFSDTIILFGMMVIFSIYISMFVKPMLDKKCFWYMHSSLVGGFFRGESIHLKQVLTSEESHKIRSFRDIAKRAIKVLLGFWVIGVEFYFVRQIIINESISIGSAGAIFYWFAVMPAFLFYGVFSNLIMVFYFVLSCKYIQVRQHTILDRLESLKRRTDLLLSSPSPPDSKESSIPNSKTASQQPRTRNRFIWHEFSQLHRKSIDLFQHLRLSNQFWSLYLTYHFIIYTFYITYSLYILLLADVTLGQQSIFIVLGNYSIGLMFAIIAQCANIVRNNDRITRHNIHIVQVFHQLGFKLRRILLKAESLTIGQWEKQDQENGLYGYRLLNNHRIDIRTFGYAFFNISVFFMLNFRTKTYSK